MAQTATLYRFRIELSDVDRGVYESLDLRTAMHPSETYPYLFTRVLAFALNSAPGLEFSPGGLSDPDTPGIQISANGAVELWIEIGNPSAKKLHRASKAAKAVKVYTYKDPNALLREVEGKGVHKAEDIKVYALSSSLLSRLEEMVERDNKWSVIHNDGVITISSSSRTEEGEIKRIRIPC